MLPVLLWLHYHHRHGLPGLHHLPLHHHHRLHARSGAHRHLLHLHLHLRLLHDLALLHLHRWSEERVCQAWLDPATPSSSAAVMTEVRRCSGECAVCCGEEEELLRIEPCGHCFCRSCWRQYLGITGGEQQGHSSCAMRCMQDGCSVVLAEPLWRAAGQQELYRQLSVRWNISVGERMRCCPTPHCPWVLCLGPLLDRVPVRCRCGGGTWCSRCGREWHAPVSCADVERWEEKCASESETGSWLAVHTKPCPRCRTRIEKNQGCNHMRCTQCGYHFCWVCMESWDDHGPETGGYYHCNRFAERSDDGEATSLIASMRSSRPIDPLVSITHAMRGDGEYMVGNTGRPAPNPTADCRRDGR